MRPADAADPIFDAGRQGPPVLTVSELTLLLKECLEGNFPRVAVVGEISNCVHAGSGHVYFTLKDDAAQLRGVIWKMRASRIRFDIRDGLQVVAIGRMDLYPARGSYQLVIDELSPHGVGPLELAFRQLHERLAAEGLFAPERKRPLPRIPRRIALVTSPQGAAVRDMLQVITRRWPGARVVIVPVPVQGDGAAQLIAAGIARLPQLPDVDVAIVGRGGGSLEDLWCFNEEVVARAIATSPVPIISAVGHEIDVTIADLVADRRALTPSEAGEIVVPDHVELAAALRHVEDRLRTAVRSRAALCRSRLDQLAGRRAITQPAEQVHHRMQRIDELDRRMQLAVRSRVDVARAEWGQLGATLSALSPLRVLERGYSLTSRAENGAVVRRVADVRPGDLLHSRVADGIIHSRAE
ncbi:MAG: exodeoxyribonuclease VII large subunit [Planctomycetaceae bacterium]|nr:exodeoxyribonuclease VII large subunit [Planctomycetaceae bacterium]